MPSRYWLANMAGMQPNDLNMVKIPYPYAELTVHVTTKTVQAGSFLGTCIVAPPLALAKGDRDFQGITQWAQTCGTYGVLLGLVAGPLMTYQRLKSVNANRAAVWDRCYRLRYNRGQVRTDRLFYIGAIAGFATATYLGDLPATMGALVGMNTCLLLAGLLNATLG